MWRAWILLIVSCLVLIASAVNIFLSFVAIGPVLSFGIAFISSMGLCLGIVAVGDTSDPIVEMNRFDD